jgi:SynChlorMet cassette protein ScmC
VRGYNLSLSDGSGWWVTSSGEELRCVDRLAAIMQLEKCPLNGLPRLVFSQMEDADSMKPCAPAKTEDIDHGWFCYDSKYVRIWRHQSIPDVLCEVKNDGRDIIEYINLCNSMHAIYQPGVEGGGLPFHAALIELDGRGVLLAAPGDTGKSTCCRRLPGYWKPLCDDETLVVLSSSRGYFAHPFPTWSEYLGKRSGRTWDVQHSVPVAAVFFLKQSEDDEAMSLGQGQTAMLMGESAGQVYRRFLARLDLQVQASFRGQLFENACAMAKRIPAFRLQVSLNGRFWEEIEKVLEGG